MSRRFYSVSRWVLAAAVTLPSLALAKSDAAKDRASNAADFAKLVAKLDNTKKSGPLTGAACASAADEFIKFGKDRQVPEAVFNGGVIYFGCGDAQKAEAAYRDALSLNGNFAPAHVNLGELAYRSGNLSTAQSEFDIALKADPKNVQAYNDAALLLVEKSKGSSDPAVLKDAIGKLRRALAVDSNSMPAYGLLAQIYFQIAESDRAKLDLAELVCKSAKEVSDKYPQIYNTLGLIKLKKKNVTGALQEFRAAADLDPTYVEAQLNIGAITLSARDYTSAEKAFQAVVNANPKNQQYLFDATLGMGVSMRGERRVDEAETWYNKAKALDGKSCAVGYDLGVLYQDYKTSEDNSHLNKAKQIFGDFVNCGNAPKDKLADATRRMKDIDDTFKALAEAKKLEEENAKMMEEVKKMQAEQDAQMKKQQEDEAKQQKAQPAAAPADPKK